MRFSVIIPLYNKAPFIRKAIESVFAQTFRDFELVVVDDGSSDGSSEEADAALAGHANARLLRQDNAGVSVARNNGVAATEAPYICFLDADDWWEPGFLEEMDRLIADFPDAGIYGTNYIIVNERKHKTRIAPIGVEDGFERGYIDYCQVYSNRLAMPLTSISVCIPRTVYAEMGGFPKGIRLGEDFILWIHIALAYKVAFVNKPLANYNQDVDQNKRAVGNLHPPKLHMLWNLQDLEPLEASHPGYRKLIDKLRVTGLMKYYISSSYHEDAKKELAKVDWSKQPDSVRREYRRPVVLLRIKAAFLRWGSRAKTVLRRLKHI